MPCAGFWKKLHGAAFTVNSWFELTVGSQTRQEPPCEKCPHRRYLLGNARLKAAVYSSTAQLTMVDQPSQGLKDTFQRTVPGLIVK